MLRIERTKDGFFEATFREGNLLAFTLSDLVGQLYFIYGFEVPFLTKFNLN